MPDLPNARIGCSLVEYNDALYLFGGFDDTGTLTNSLLRWKPGYGKWEEVRQLGNVRVPYLNAHTAVVYKDELWVFGVLRSLRLAVREMRILAFNFETRLWRFVEHGDQMAMQEVSESTVYGHCFYKNTLLVATSEKIYSYNFEANRWTSVYREQGLRVFHGQYHMLVHVKDHFSTLFITRTVLRRGTFGSSVGAILLTLEEVHWQMPSSQLQPRLI